MEEEEEKTCVCFLDVTILPRGLQHTPLIVMKREN
jgi:hypothetical protein